eukprot:4734754-Amphidinium_carterae.1
MKSLTQIQLEHQRQLRGNHIHPERTYQVTAHQRQRELLLRYYAVLPLTSRSHSTQTQPSR